MKPLAHPSFEHQTSHQKFKPELKSYSENDSQVETKPKPTPANDPDEAKRKKEELIATVKEAILGDGGNAQTAQLPGKGSKPAHSIKKAEQAQRPVPYRDPEATKEQFKYQVRQRILANKLKMQVKGAALPDTFVDTEVHAEKQRAGIQSTRRSQDEPASPASEQKPSTEPKQEASNEPFRLLCATSEFEPPSPSPDFEDSLQRSTNSSATSWERAPRHTFNLAPGSPVRPNPKLTQPPRPVVTELHGGGLKSPVTALKKSNTWFHEDGRGYEQLRRQLINLAQAHGEDRANFDGASAADAENSKHMTLLLGNLIVNLHAYIEGDRKVQASDFANFGVVPDGYCESAHGGHQSYFERDPVTTRQRRNTGSVAGDVGSKRLVFGRFNGE